jgi:hypothetical protein
MTKTYSPIPIYFHDCADDLRIAGPAAMLVAGFLMDNANSIGFFQLNFDKVTRAVGIPMPEIKALMPVFEKIGFLRYHAESEMVWIIDYAVCRVRHLRATNKKMIAQANAEFAAIPKTCPMRVDFLWKHALMLRLEIQGAASPSEMSFDSRNEMPLGLIPKVAAENVSGVGLSEREI